MNSSSFIFKTIDAVTNLIMNPAHIEAVTCKINDQYDIYYADKQTKGKPIIVNIHGGGFVGGDKKYRRYWCELLAQHGWFVINTNYRLCPEVTIIEQIKDVWAVVEQLESIAAKYQLNQRTIVISGDSSGAFLAAYMVALMTNPKLRRKLKVTKTNHLRFSGALLFCGVYDLPKMLEQGEQNNSNFVKDLAQKMTGLEFEDLAAVKKYPYYHDLSIAQFLNSNWCPVQIFYSQKDVFVKGQGEKFYQKLRAQNIPVRRHYTKKFLNNHCYHLFFMTSVAKTSLKITKDFLDKISGC